MPRAKLTYEDRCWLEDALKRKVDSMEICRHFGISTYQLQLEKRLGWQKEQKTYSAWKAQSSLK